MRTAIIALKRPDGQTVESPVILVDRTNGTETDLTATAYTFTTQAGTIKDRFVIHLGSMTAISTTDSTFNVKGSLFNVYDLQGRRIATPKKGLYIKDHKKVVVK